MLMRGLNVPSDKKWYIFKDACREARSAKIRYGKVADPLGKATENCYAIFEYALAHDKAIEWMRAFAVAVNAEGVSGATEKGLEKICHTAGLDWQKARQYLANKDWQSRCTENEKILSRYGFWGVPCFRYGDLFFWGQDRLWLLNQSPIKRP